MKIKQRYDKNVDAMYVEFSDKKVYKTREMAKGIIVDYDRNEYVVGVEVLDAAKRNFVFKIIKLPRTAVQFSAGRQKIQVPISA